VPRTAKFAASKVTVANATDNSTMLKHDVCLTSKVATKTDCEAKPARAFALNEAGFFLQVATESDGTKTT
jgi:hypothetical protein